MKILKPIQRFYDSQWFDLAIIVFFFIVVGLAVVSAGKP